MYKVYTLVAGHGTLPLLQQECMQYVMAAMRNHPALPSNESILAVSTAWQVAAVQAGREQRNGGTNWMCFGCGCITHPCQCSM